jgi:hypothetical protein
MSKQMNKDSTANVIIPAPAVTAVPVTVPAPEPPTAPAIKVAHWTMFNNSGMYRMAESFAKEEGKQGIDSWLCDVSDRNYKDVLDADIHVVHTHLPDDVRPQLLKPLKLVWVGHGSVEHVFQSSVESGLKGGYGAGDGWALCQYWMQQADALVTFWPRQQAIWKSLCDKATIVECIPLGVELDFWKPTQSQGKYMGTPSVFTAENCHYTKWPLDLFLCWPWVWPEVPEAFLHAVYIPNDQHKWYFPLVNRNGCRFKTIMSAAVLDPVSLRNAFCSTDFFIGLVRYGDYNRLSMEASACGAKTISYAGNEYADYWITEGDQRIMAKELTAILKGDTPPRAKLSVPDMKDMVRSMIDVYRRIL